MKPADPLRLPLAGLSLVEASAGTGKTTLLVRLYLRALLVAGFRAEQILAVTYTRAATGELSVRIRRELEATARQLDHPEKRDDFRSELFELVDNDGAVKKRITAALAAFDEKAVFTIHGFCRRVLADNAFEAGAAFASEQSENEDSLRGEIAADFWRRRVGTRSPTYVKWFVATFKSPDNVLHKTLKDALQVSGRLAVEPQAGAAEVRKAQIAFDRATRDAAEAWHRDAKALHEWLAESEDLNRQTYRKATTAKLLDEWKNWLAASPCPVLPDHFERLTRAKAEASLKGGRVPEKPFFTHDCAAALQNASNELLAVWWQEAVTAAYEFVNSEARRRKRKTRELGFDDMLLNLRDALKAPSGKGLARRIAGRYPLVLVDEFQDTDPLQHDIFTAIHAADKAHGLILIGDPKQAIYRFRGADIFTYMQARAVCEEAGRLYGLTDNYRSAEPLLTAVNALFGNADNPFGYAQIPYTAVAPGRNRPPIASLVMPEGDDAPTTIVWQDSPDGKPWNKDEAINHVVAVGANEIARLLALGRAGKARVGEACLQAKDIAVLVNDNRQGLRIQDALRRRGIASAMVAAQSVFGSGEAAELEIVLAAVAEPSNGRLLRRALATQLLGATAAQLAAWSREETGWDEVVGRFREYYALWQARGFTAMFARLVNGEGVIERTLARPDGERAMTNLRHLAELAGAEAARRPGIAPLLAWFGAERGEEASEESRQLRLESDENLVRIATIHKAKGLQYPVVFLPFLWDGKKPRGQSNPAVISHDADFRAVLDLGSDAADDRRKEAERERRAENLRRSYVALTRAERACYLIALPANQCEESALGRLLNVNDASDFRAGLQRWVAQASGAIRLRGPASGADADAATVERPHGEARAFKYPERLRQRFHIASYSLLVAGASGGIAEAPEHDENVSPPPLEVPASGIHAFPAGAASGTFLHALIEALPFAAGESTIANETQKRLAAHGFDPVAWTEPLVRWLVDVFATPLGEPGCTLSAISGDKRRNEMEFHFLLDRIEAETLDAAVSAFAPHVSRPGLRFDALEGQMKGYIDLIFEHGGKFWVADYKSNRLGSDLAAYTPAALDQAMAEHRYDLQYLVYTVALHRYLRTRIPGYDYDKHFGGVLYLFLRGMAPDASAPRGVWCTRPPKADVERLDAYFAGAAP